MFVPNERKLRCTESQKRSMNSQHLVFWLVIDEARFLEPTHEKTNPRPGGPYQFCQRLVAYLLNRHFGTAVPIIVGQEQKNTRQSFLATKSCSYRMFPANTYAKNILANLTCRVSASIMTFFVIRRRVQSVIAVADAVRED